ncbi:MAG: TetR/AcrR family transcriptional regulator [Candidatus Dormibacteria bacterium]|nr:helix-turn-helix domain-containing protein [Candidatus Saccharimonadales bacterium]
MPRLLDSTREQRRRQLLDAAWRCIARQGFRDLTVDDVCADAGLSKGAFYSHFVSKEALLLALIADDAASIARVAEDPETLRLGPVQRIRKLTETMLMQGADPARVQLRADVWGAMPTYPAIRAVVTAAVAERQRVLREWVDEAVTVGDMTIDFPPNALAALLLAISDGLVLHYALDPNAFRWGKIGRAVDGMLEGFSTRRRPEEV